MFFKRIEMVGFKSFATKTVCEFLPGTTVIVGPNGCGKSNILDAIKWVLGEQAASQMRGKKMADVIFAGSASFKPLGVAQVTLTVDNSRRILPVDYEEVQVTRRLFRSGESEYLLNKQPCRLRDIHNLFLGTGIGKSAYSMLEQGRVDQIINAKPAERRFLIEEAAGISKFKVRKLEALRKLERTDVDLSRLNDLLSEVQRQVNSLKRQAGKAERYKDLYESCRRGEQELLVLRSRDLSEKIKTLRADFQQLGDKLTSLRTELDTRAAAEQAARDQEIELNDRLSDESQALYDLKSNLKEAENQITRLNDKIAVHSSRMAQIDEELREMDIRANELELRIEEIDTRLEEAEHARQTNQQLHDELKQRYSELEATNRDRTERIEALGTEVNRLREVIARADNEMRAAEATIESRNEARQEAERLLDSLEIACLEHTERHETLSRQAETLRADLDTLGADLETRKTEQADRQRQLAANLTSLEGIRRDLHQRQSRLETLNELKASYEGYYQGVREVMLAADHNQLAGVLGVAANLVRAQQDHELAIEVALATHLQDIVTRTAEDAKACIEYLKTSGRGRATFLPLDRLQPTPLPAHLRQVLNRPGVIGLASELVQFDPQIQKAVDFMLGTTIVVRDLDVGLDLGGEGFRARYVSLDGQLINPGGSMTGGRVKTTGLMMREREIRELEEAVSRHQADQERLVREIEQLQAGMSASHEHIESLQRELEHKRNDQTALMKDLEAAERGRDEAQSALDERLSRIQQIDEEVAQRRQLIEQWTNERLNEVARLQTAESELNELKENARTHGDDIIHLGTSVAEALAEVEKARERAENARHQRESIVRDLEAFNRQRQNRLNEVETLKQEDELLHEQIRRIDEENKQARTECAELTERLSQDQTAREQLIIEIREIAQAVETLTRDERALDNHYRESEVRLAEFQTNLNSLSEQCEEKFQLDLETLAAQLGEIEPRDPHALHAEVAEMRERLARMGVVNMAALEEYEQQSKRLEFLQTQHTDLTQAKEQLESTIAKLDETTRKLFHETFEAVRAHFIEMFRRLFNGGKADLILEAPEGLDPLLEGGVEILAQPPGKKLQNISLMSGGEKAMTAIALLFGLFLYKPAPFCILDEIDAPLDDTNVGRFKQAVAEFKKDVQFVVITHNKLTMELSDALYGVTMEESGVSKLVSVRFEQAAEMVDQAV